MTTSEKRVQGLTNLTLTAVRPSIPELCELTCNESEEGKKL